MIEIKDVKKKGQLMILMVEDDSVPPISFTLEIDANADKEMVWKHIKLNHQMVLKERVQPVEDVKLTEKWKGEKRVSII